MLPLVFCGGFGDLNAGPHVCTADVTLSEPSLQPHNSIFWLWSCLFTWVAGTPVEQHLSATPAVSTGSRWKPGWNLPRRHSCHSLSFLSSSHVVATAFYGASKHQAFIRLISRCRNSNSKRRNNQTARWEGRTITWLSHGSVRVVTPRSYLFCPLLSLTLYFSFPLMPWEITSNLDIYNTTQLSYPLLETRDPKPLGVAELEVWHLQARGDPPPSLLPPRGSLKVFIWNYILKIANYMVRG